jgi:LysM repeat protein
MDAVATAKLALEKSSFESGLKEAENAVSKFAKQTAGILGGAFAFDKLLGGLTSAIDKGDELQDIAEKFGVSASKLQMLGNAASVFGSDISAISAGLNKLSLAQQKAVSGESGAEELISVFGEVGVTMEQLKTMSAEDIFLKISDSFASGANEGRQFVIVNELLGKAQTDLIKVMNQGSGAITEQGMAMGVWSDDTIASLSQASDEIKTFQNTMMIAFGTAAQLANPLIQAFKAVAEQIGMIGASILELVKGNVTDAKAIAVAAYRELKGKNDQPATPAAKAIGGEGSKTSGKDAAKAAKEAEKAEKDAIKERTDEAMRALKEEEDEKKIAADSEERRRQYIFESEREAINEKIKQNEEAAKYQQKYNEWLAGAPDRARQGQQATGQAAGQRLDIAAGLGGGVAAEVEKARKKAAEDQKKVTQGQLDKEVLASTSATKVGSFGIGTAQRSMSERRSEYIQTQAKKEAEGKTTLDDINKTLQDALAKLTSAPLVS